MRGKFDGAKGKGAGARASHWTKVGSWCGCASTIAFAFLLVLPWLGPWLGRSCRITVAILLVVLAYVSLAGILFARSRMAEGSAHDERAWHPARTLMGIGIASLLCSALLLAVVLLAALPNWMADLAWVVLGLGTTFAALAFVLAALVRRTGASRSQARR